MEFTKEQKEIIESDDQHIFVIASAGTGKSATLIGKVGHLINHKNVSPDRILMTSFSKVASKELYDKVAKNYGRDTANDMFISTIHALAYRICKENESLLGLKNFNIVQESYLSSIVYNRDPKLFEKRKDYNYEVGKWKQAQIENIDYLQDDNIIQAFEDAQEIMEESNKILFDDLLLKSVYLLEMYESVRNHWKKQFDYLISDECLPYYTPIHLSDGSYKFIGDIVENKEQLNVLTYNEKEQKQESCKIVGWNKNPNNKPMVKIKCRLPKRVNYKFHYNHVVCTTDHKIFTYNRGWVEAGLVKEEDIIQVETQAFKNNKYKISDKGKSTLSTLMYTDEKAIKNSKKGNRKKRNEYTHLQKNRKGNGHGPTEPQLFLFNKLNEFIESGWSLEGVVIINPELKDLYKTPFNYKIDILNESNKLCIEIDGHSHETNERKLQDEKKNKVLEKMGYKVIRYKNLEVFKNIENIIEDIKSLNIKNTCIVQAQIVSVESASIKEYYTYDLTVEKNHNFYANGILVHNCQDTNRIQFEILEYLIDDNTHTCIVGDVKQNIYAFRGAHYKNMENFRKFYGSKVFYLSETFRFNQEFTNLSNKVIDVLDIDQIYKKYTVTNVKEGKKPEFYILDTVDQEDEIISDIKKKIKEGYKYSDLNIIYRYNKEALPYMKKLVKNNIPFEVKSGDVFQREEIVFIVKIFELLENFTYDNCSSLFSKYPDFVGDNTLRLMYNEYSESENALDFLKKVMENKIKGIGEKRIESISKMYYRLENINNFFLSKYPKEKINILDIATYMDIDDTKFMSKKEDASGEMEFEVRWEFLGFFQESYAENTETNNIIEWYNNMLVKGTVEDKNKKDAVQLKTIHGCKGQSLPVVYFLSNRMFFHMFVKTDEDVKNEYFALYVALTRVEKELHIFKTCLSDYIDIIFPRNELDYKAYKCDTLSPAEFISSNSDMLSNVIEVEDTFKYKKLKNDIFPVKNTGKAVLFQSDKEFWIPVSMLRKTENNDVFVAEWLVKKNNYQKYVVI